VWWRPALAALICFIAMPIESSVFGSNLASSKDATFIVRLFQIDRVVSVAKPCCSWVFKPIFKEHRSPDVEIESALIAQFVRLVSQVNNGATLKHLGLRRERVVTLNSEALNRQIAETITFVYRPSNAPPDMLGGEITGIFYDDIGMTLVLTPRRADTGRIDSDIGTLENASICLLFGSGITGRFPELIRGKPERDCRKGENDGETGNQRMLVSLQETEQWVQSDPDYPWDSAAKRGAVILFVIVAGCCWVALLARRK
jgi:hypothetical protein